MINPRPIIKVLKDASIIVAILWIILIIGSIGFFAAMVNKYCIKFM